MWCTCKRSASIHTKARRRKAERGAGGKERGKRPEGAAWKGRRGRRRRAGGFFSLVLRSGISFTSMLAKVRGKEAGEGCAERKDEGGGGRAQGGGWGELLQLGAQIWHFTYLPQCWPREPLITNIMWRNLLGQCAYQLILLLVLQFRGKQLLGLQDDDAASGIEHSHAYKEVETMIFNAFVFCQVFNELNARKPEEINILKGLWTSKIFLYVIAFTVLVQVVLVEICGSFTSTVHLSWHRWLLCVAFGVASMPLAAIIKCIPVPKQPIWSSWQHRDDLVFREGGSVMSMMLRQGSQKVDLQRTRSVKSTKFYTEFSVDGSNSPADSDSCFRKFKRSICPLGITPSASNDVENPNRRYSNEAWR